MSRLSTQEERDLAKVYGLEIEEGTEALEAKGLRFFTAYSRDGRGYELGFSQNPTRIQQRLRMEKIDRESEESDGE